VYFEPVWTLYPVLQVGVQVAAAEDEGVIVAVQSPNPPLVIAAEKSQVAGTHFPVVIFVAVHCTFPE
jgi:hypothetical protein